MKTKYRHHRGFTLVELLVVIAIIAALAGFATPVILRAQKKAQLASATNNLKNLGPLLFEFDQDWGSFPSMAIKERDQTNKTDQFKDITPSGTTSNGLLGMLIAGGYTQSEEIFYVKGGSKTNQPPDNVITQGRILEAGECGFGYVMKNTDEAMSSSDNSNRPVLVAPLETSGGDGTTFNSEVFDQKALYLRLDQSVQQPRLNKQTKKIVLQGTGKDLFEPGTESVWGDDQPTVLKPE